MKDLELETCAKEAEFVFSRGYERITRRKECGARFRSSASLKDQRLPWKNNAEIYPQRAEIERAFRDVGVTTRANAVVVVYDNIGKVEIDVGSVCRWGEFFSYFQFSVPAKSPSKILEEERGWKMVEKVLGKKPEEFFEEVLRKEIARCVDNQLAQKRVKDAVFLADQLATLARARAEQDRGYDGRIRAIRQEQKDYEEIKLGQICKEAQETRHDQDPRVVAAAIRHAAEALAGKQAHFGHREVHIDVEEVL